MGTRDLVKQLDEAQLRLRAKREELKYKYREIDVVENDIRELQSLYHDIAKRVYYEKEKKSA